MPHAQSNARTSTGVIGLLLTVILFVISVIEWTSWTPQSSFLRTILPTLGQTISFWISVAILALSLYCLNNNKALQVLVNHYSFLWLATTKSVRWSPLNKKVADTLPALSILISVSILIVTAIPTALRDISTIIPVVTTSYVLSISAIIIRLIKIPRAIQPTLEKGYLSIGKHEYYAVLDITGLLAYVYNEGSGQWERAASTNLIARGEQARLFNMSFQLQATEQIKLDQHPAFDANIELNIHIKHDNFPDRIINEDITRLMRWVNSPVAEKKKMLEIAAGKLCIPLDKQLKQLFCISEQGQFMFDSLARIAKGHSLNAWDPVPQLNCTPLSQHLEKHFSTSLFGRTSIANVYAVDISITELELQHPYREISEALMSLRTSHNSTGMALRKKAVKKLTDLYTKLCPSNDPQQIAIKLQSLLEDHPIQVKKIGIIRAEDKKGTTEVTPASSISVTDTGELLMPIWEDDKVFKAAQEIASLGEWLDAQPNLAEKVTDYRIWPEFYFRLREKKLIRSLPPGLRKNALVIAIERALHLDASQLIDPHSRLYMDFDFRMSIAGRIVHKN